MTSVLLQDHGAEFPKAVGSNSGGSLVKNHPLGWVRFAPPVSVGFGDRLPDSIDAVENGWTKPTVVNYLLLFSAVILVLSNRCAVGFLALGALIRGIWPACWTFG